MAFIFNKKRKNFNSALARHSSIPVRRSELAYSRLAKNRSVFFQSLLFKILILLICAGVVYLLFFSSVFKVAKIIIVGNTTVNADEIRQTVDNIANKKVFKFFNNSLILIKTDEVEKAIREKFNSVNSASAVKKFPETLAISITEKPADILWCNKIKVEKASAVSRALDNNPAPVFQENLPQEALQCYFSDEANIIYRKAESGAPVNSVRVFRDDSINIGDKIADDAVKNFIRGLVKNFNYKTGLEFSYLYLPSISSRELHLFAKGGWKIYFDLNRPADDQLDDLNSVWREAIPESYKNNMEYIDLRVPGRVPWKPKNETVK